MKKTVTLKVATELDVDRLQLQIDVLRQEISAQQILFMNEIQGGVLDKIQHLAKALKGGCNGI